MRFYIDSDNNVYAYENDCEEKFIAEGLTPITENEANEILNPPPTKEELIAAAEYERQCRIDAANDLMNSKQWPGKAAIGRLKGDELVQYNLWLDYLDALEAVDTSSAPDIKWPTPPGEQAS
ncbi:tail fiber assembly protein [Citrobacter freundii]|uniref:tail fiber assembly protein n=1 Tax=Citrobacter freundii TaxID=546 RepID=UPI001902C352|nr:tail fiber assembly protein [Citrobacter freundii]MBJ9856872.1 tail fiber assembly protein [Citrobacter freundii]